MDNKIQWYEEILALEPHSKLFYSLAVMYREAGLPEKVLTVLNGGLQHHPEHFPARLLAAQVYWEQGQVEEATRSLQPIVENLERTPCLWPLWAKQHEAENVGTALQLAGALVQEPTLRWESVLQAGLQVFANSGTYPEQSVPASSDLGAADEETAVPQESESPGQQPESGPGPDAAAQSESPSPFEPQAETVAPAAAVWEGIGRQAPQAEPPEEEPEDDPDEEPAKGQAPVRTKTMAAILAEQGEYGEAEAIYADLLARASDDQERESLSQQLEAVRQQRNASQEDSTNQDLLSTLQLLAERLEARGSNSQE
ncbi:MAG: tetratricopeptide repeat protein [Desulfohalobium sp.]